MAIIKKFDFTSLNIGPKDLEINPATGMAYDNYFENIQQGDHAPTDMVTLSTDFTHPSFPNSIKYDLNWRYPRYNGNRVSQVYRTETGTRYPGLNFENWCGFTVIHTSVEVEAGRVFYQIFRQGRQVLTLRITGRRLTVRIKEALTHPMFNWYFDDFFTANTPVTFIVKCNMLFGSGEYLKVWGNDVLLVDYAGDVTDADRLTHGKLHCQHKFGAYVSEWNDHKTDENGDLVYFEDDGFGNPVPKDPFPADPNNFQNYFTSLAFADVLDNDKHTYQALHPDGNSPLSGVKDPVAASIIYSTVPSGAGNIVDERGKPQYYTGDTLKLSTDEVDFLRWEINGKHVGKEPQISHKIESVNTEVVAIYASTEGFLLIVADPVGGVIDKISTAPHIASSLVELKAYPAENYAFSHWIIDGVTVDGPMEYSFSMPAKHIIVSAQFSAVPLEA